MCVVSDVVNSVLLELRVVLSWHTPEWFVVLAEEVVALIRNRYSALVWVNRAEWEVFCRRLAFGQHIEKGGFPVEEETRT